MHKGLHYLASPYSSPDATTRHLRFIAACRAAAKLMQQGVVVFCPIAHSHPIGETMNGKALDHGFWMAQDLPILAKCSRLVVLKLDGWGQSRGVHEEIGYALAHGIPVEYMEPTGGPSAYPRAV